MTIEQRQQAAFRTPSHLSPQPAPDPWGLMRAPVSKEYAFGDLPTRLITYPHPHANQIGVPGGHFYGYPTSDITAMGHPAMGIGFPLIDDAGRTVNFLRMGTAWALEDRLFISHPVAGCHILIGARTAKVLITVDPIDAMALNAATGLQTVAVLYAENLRNVCHAIRDRGTTLQFHLCINGVGEIDTNPTLWHARKIDKAVTEIVSISGDLTFKELFRQQGGRSVVKALTVMTKAYPFDPHHQLRSVRIPPPALPWPHRVHGESIMKSLIATFHRYIDLPEHDACLVALWVVHTYTLPASRFSPLLAIVSPEYGCGKSTLLALLQRLCFKALRTSKISFAKLLQVTRELHPTLILDEAKQLLEGPSSLPFFIAGHDRASGEIIADHKKALEVAETFVPKAVGLVGELPEPLLERAIQIKLHRISSAGAVLPAVPIATPTEHQNDDLTALSAQIARWAVDHLAELSVAQPERLPLGSPRMRDTFSPLLSIAHVMGKEVAGLAEAAIIQSMSKNEVKSPGVLLLEHLSTIINSMHGDILPTSDILQKLCADDEWPWATYNRGKQLDALWLSKLLKPYNLTPCKRGGGAIRGYRANELQDAIRRYVPMIHGHKNS